MRVAWKCDSMGISGVTSACFTFDVLAADYPNYAYSIPGGAEVIIRCTGRSNFSKAYYVSKAEPSQKGIISVTCYDRTLFTECDFPCTEEDFIDLDGNEVPMSVSACLAKIAESCGFRACMFPVDVIGQADFSLPKSSLMGRTCHDVLNIVANALAGYWVLSNSGLGDGEQLYLTALGARNNMVGNAYAVYHEKLEYTSRVEIRSVLLTDCGYVYGGDTGGTDTIRIDTPAASLDLYSALESRLVGYTYNGFKCGHALLDCIPDFPASVSFAGESSPVLCNSFDISFSSSGFLAEVGSNTIDAGAWKYIPKTQREIEQRYKEGEIWENVEITKKGGIKYVVRDENTGATTKYGLDVKKNNVIIHDANNYSKIPASDIIANDDATEVSYKNGETQITLSIEWDGDNIKSYSRTIEDSEGNVIFSDEEENE